MKKTGIAMCFLLFCMSAAMQAQAPARLHPGFDAKECDELLNLNFAFLDTVKDGRLAHTQAGYRFVYRSPAMGLDNQWDMWLKQDSTIVIALRGTTADPKSILADLYCAMLPAKGQLTLGPGDIRQYKLASDPRAAVHAGFLVGFCYLSKDIFPKIDSLYRLGYRDCLVTGHSQGGSLCYYISAWLLQLRENKFPGLQVKTYASAPTKIGNMYFAYDYDNRTRSEWTYSVINSADPVPEFPFTTQQIEADMNEPNPFMGLYKRFDGLPEQQRTMLKGAFDKMRKASIQSSVTYQKYFGGYSEQLIKRMVPGLKLPPYANTTYFVRPGVPIILLVNDAYFKKFEVNDGPYYHHGVTPYRFLLRQYYEGLEELGN